ncbi:globin-coupled sensor protein [Gracilibacillus salinarum]|nr:globin-coupled sensor protein [Gracilibacillus salinarum]
MSIFTKKQKTTTLLAAAEKERPHVKIDIQKDTQLLEQMEIIELTLEDLAVARTLQPLIQEHIADIYNPIYYHRSEGIRKVVDMTAIGIDLEGCQNYVISFFDGIINDAFAEKRYRISSYYLKVGVEVRWYICTNQIMANHIFDILKEVYKEDLESYSLATKVVSKVLNLELQLCLSALQELQQEAAADKENQAKQGVKHSIGSITEELAGMSEEVGASVEDAVDRSGSIQHDLSEGLASSNATQETAETGRKQLDQVMAETDSLTSSVNEIKTRFSSLEANSREIGDIVAVITEIAEQTNLLALNAAIEAARAGEHGKGFSVVASEVRKLAEQTKASSSNITTMIHSTTDHIADLVGRINEINAKSLSVNEYVQETIQNFEDILASSLTNKEQNERNNQEMLNFIQILQEIGEVGSKVAELADELNQTMQGY